VSIGSAAILNIKNMRYFFIFFLVFFSVLIFGQNMVIDWDKCLGFKRQSCESSQPEEHEPVYWRLPEEVVNTIPWRGLSPFGYERDWIEIALPEAIGLAREAVEQQQSNPVDYIFNVFKLKRRHAKTASVFQSWIEAAQDSFVLEHG